MDYKLQISRKTFDVLKKFDNSKKEEIVRAFDKILKNPFNFKPLKYELKGSYTDRTRLASTTVELVKKQTGSITGRYTIGTRTVDVNGTINATMVTNTSATTMPVERYINGTVLDKVNRSAIAGVIVSTNGVDLYERWIKYQEHNANKTASKSIF